MGDFQFEPSFRLLVQLAAVGFVLALWIAAVLLWLIHRSRRMNRLQQRLGLSHRVGREERVLSLWHEGRMIETTVPNEAGFTFLQRLEFAREDAGWELPMTAILSGLLVVILITALLIVLLTGNPLIALASSIAWLLGFRGVLQLCINRRRARFEKQLVDALDLGSRSLRAGHPLNGAFRLIAQEIDPPLRHLFSEIVEREALGLSVQRSLSDAATRSRNPDMKIFAASVIMQLRSGGNLADMMERVAWVVRERMRLNRRARVLTAEAQLSKWVLLALPVGLLVLLSLMNRDYMEPLYSTAVGVMMLVGASISMLIGAWVMNWLSKLDY